MRRLVFIVEGNTEVNFINKSIIPYLHEQGFENSINAQTIVTSRKLHKKGGVVSYGSFRNEVERTLAQPNVIVTTLIDFFKLPGDFPNYTNDSTKIPEIEQAILDDFENIDNLIPYIQRHEIESLMFSSMDGFSLVMDDQKQLEEAEKIIHTYNNPEDINNSPQTAPSKRLEKIFNYDKIADGEIIFEMVGLDVIIDKCPRFSEWIIKLTEKLNHFNN